MKTLVDDSAPEKDVISEMIEERKNASKTESGSSLTFILLLVVTAILAFIAFKQNSEKDGK